MISGKDIVDLNKFSATFGGSSGLRDFGLLMSSVGRYENTLNYSDSDPAFAVMESIIRNHPFVDGNKRTAFLTLISLKLKDGKSFYIKPLSVAFALDKLASGDVTLSDIEEYFKENEYDTDIVEISELLSNNNGLSSVLDILARKDADLLNEEEKEFMNSFSF